jgi:AcrR family transcriptional regulator
LENIKKDKREAILLATMELIAEHGFHGAPTAMIAKRAGVAIGSIYRYFADKDALIEKVHEEIRNAAMKVIALGYDRNKPLSERFFHLAKGLLKYMLSRPMEFRFVEQFYYSPYGIEMHRETFYAEMAERQNIDIMKELYEHGVAQRAIKDLDLPVFFALAFGSLFNVARDHVAGFIKLDDNKIDQIVGACWDAVKR